ncbi:MAG: hypothetical protein ACK4SL_00485 [Candidatus Paceibacteria bacterium]
MIGLQPRIAAMTSQIFGDDFIEVHPQIFEMPCLDLLLKRGVPKRKKHDLQEFRGWLALFADKPNPARPEGPIEHYQV